MAFALLLVSGKASYQDKGPWNGVRGEALAPGPRAFYTSPPLASTEHQLSGCCTERRSTQAHSQGVTLALGEESAGFRLLLSNV